MQTFKFSKMHGAGNDYIYVNCFEEKVENINETAKAVSDRHFGIGSDGLILIKPSDIADCEMDMYNLDGSRGAMCGNGIRCVGKYAYDHGIVDKLKCAETQRVVSVSMCTTEVLQTRHRLLLKRWRV